MTRFTISMILLLACEMLCAQSRPYNVVFDLTSKDTLDQQAVFRWVKGISKSHSGAKLEIVLYGEGIELALKDKSAVSSDVMELTANNTVTVNICGAAMKRHNIDKSQLLPGVKIVPDGIYEIISKEAEGWGYIKVAR
jgi:uncharacterized protein